MSLRWIGLDELGAVIGKENATALCRTHGGREPYLPRRPKKGHAFVRIIGWDALVLLAAYAGGYHLDLPNLRRPAPAKEAIWDALDAGKSHDAIAEEYGVTTRYVRGVKRMRRSARREKALKLPIWFPDGREL